MSASDMEVANWIKTHSPVTESEYAEGNPQKDGRAAKSALARAHRKYLIQRIVTIEEKGRPVWLYYADEEQISTERNRQIYVPLRRLDEFKREIVAKEIKQLQKEGVYQVSIATIARRAGFPPSQIENEVYALIDKLGSILVEKEVRPIGLGPEGGSH
jgi:predicted transcriptional regulator